MRRRDFIGLLGGVAAWPSAVNGQPKRIARIGFLGNVQAPTLWQAFLEGLREHGWEEGHNLIIESRWAQGRTERYSELAAELVLLSPDLIVASSPPAVRAVQQATRTIPIVMTAVAYPVE